MTAIAHWRAAAGAGELTRERDATIDTLRGIAILLVIGIHSLPKDDSTLVTAIDAAMRPCVAIFLFASGYMTARSGQVPLGKRTVRALGPYTVAFVAAYLVMVAQNPLIDHRPTIFVARYLLAYVFVYYYVFVYVGCTVLLWLAFAAVGPERADRQARLIALLSLAIIAGLATGAYLEPVLQRLDVPAPVIAEVRMRDLAFWFGFMAAGAIIGQVAAEPLLRRWCASLMAAAALAYAVYASVRVYRIGDASDYDSLAFFVYALLTCVALLALSPRWRVVGALGRASYAIYLWHIFAIVALRPVLAPLDQPAAVFLIQYAAALVSSLALIVAVKSARAPRLAQWLGA